MRRSTAPFLAAVLCASPMACGDSGSVPEPDAGSPADTAVACDPEAVRPVVETFGQRLRNVSLLAPDSIVRRDIQQHYGPLVSADLLNAWMADPSAAPGREVSSPSPDRIQIQAITASASGECQVDGVIAYVTSADADASPVHRVPVLITVRNAGGWRIVDYTADSALPGSADSAGPSDPAGGDSAGDASEGGDAAGAAAVIEQYYAAIDAHDYQRAYRYWDGDGRASGQTYDDFAAGFAKSAQVEVTVGAPGRIEGAAGSRFIALPVTIRATTTGGEQQRFAGTYTLRRSVVDGATRAQRAWRIHSADVRRL